MKKKMLLEMFENFSKLECKDRTEILKAMVETKAFPNRIPSSLERKH